MIQEKDRKPLVIGVTGHLQIRQEDRETLYKAVERELKALAEDNRTNGAPEEEAKYGN